MIQPFDSTLIGEALVGEGPKIAHIDPVIGPKGELRRAGVCQRPDLAHPWYIFLCLSEFKALCRRGAE